ncbi:MAG: hypothetical protein EPO07_11460 [Verrucomicrobia bacterium]|nr:MAG: hypothetical protein EPO07_11460 [Verrucomicrobiota bacterium]
MFQKEVIALGLTAIIIFTLVAGAASLAIRAVERDAKLVAQDTLPGLVNAGEALNRIQENWLNATLLLHTPDAPTRARLIEKVNTNATDAFWEKYQESIFGQRDADTFKDMQQCRTEFIALRKEYFELVAAGKMDDAARLYESQLKAAFEKYRNNSLALFTYNADLGQSRADRILQISTWTPFALAGFCVLVLMLGVFVGFKATLGAFSGNWSENLGTTPSKS